MSNDDTPQVGNVEPGAPSTEEPGAPQTVTLSDVDALRRELAETRREATKHRTELRKLQEEQARRGEADLVAQQKWEELAKKRAEELAAIQRDLETERIARLRLEVATEKRLDVRLSGRLQGSTREELEADADAMLQLMTPAAPMPDRPQAPDLNVTGVPTAKNPKTPIAKLTPQELAVAQKMGLTADEYAKWKES